jgi:hypothetical protein
MRKLTVALLLTLLAGIAQAQFIQPKVFNLSSGGLIQMLAKGDFNRDHKLDVLFSASNSTGQPVRKVSPGSWSTPSMPIPTRTSLYRITAMTTGPFFLATVPANSPLARRMRFQSGTSCRAISMAITRPT